MCSRSRGESAGANVGRGFRRVLALHGRGQESHTVGVGPRARRAVAEQQALVGAGVVTAGLRVGMSSMGTPRSKKIPLNLHRIMWFRGLTGTRRRSPNVIPALE